MLKNLFTSFLFSSILLYCLSANAQEGLDKIVNPKTAGNGYVSNADSILTENTVQQINTLVKPLDQQGKAQIAVVLVNSIGDQVPKEFATALFRKWGIGNKEKNNGLLILLVKDRRRMEFEVGYGLEGVITDGRSNRIQKEIMLPYFRDGDYNTGILKGVEKVVSTISTGVDQSADEDRPTQNIGIVLGGNILFFIIYIVIYCMYTLSARGQYVTHSASWLWLVFLFFGPLAILVLVASLRTAFTDWTWFLLITYCCWSVFFSVALRNLLKSPLKGDTRLKQYQYLKLVTGGITIYTLLFPLPFLFIAYFASKRRLNHLRYDPYDSPDGSGEMEQIKENKAEEMTAAEKMEERLGSVSYDFWKAKAGGYVMKLAYLNQDTKVRRCKKCRSMTAKRTKRVVEKRATRKSGGVISIYYTCQVCGRPDFINQSTSRRTDYNIFRGIGAGGFSAGGSSSSGSGYSGNSGSSGSSSSSSDWGGGSSGGGGSGSDW